MEDLSFKIEVVLLWIKDRQSRFDDSIKPHQQLIHIFWFIICRKSPYYEDIVKL